MDDPTLHIPLGSLTRPHGYDGALLLESPRYLPDSVADLETVFIYIDGLPVPFFPEDIRLTGDNTAVLKLEDVASEACRSLLGCEVSCLAEDLQDDYDAGEDAAAWTGFTVRDAGLQTIGILDDIEDFNGNIVLHVRTGEDEVLVPFHEDLLVSLDTEQRILTLVIPDGLLPEKA
ncbi:MAG: hypothetical protein IKI72_08080 [Bacteroidales bacterium]|nr:hypothetical protein [Bacteroidales bacterium]